MGKKWNSIKELKDDSQDKENEEFAENIHVIVTINLLLSPLLVDSYGAKFPLQGRDETMKVFFNGMKHGKGCAKDLKTDDEADKDGKISYIDLPSEGILCLEKVAYSASFYVCMPYIWMVITSYNKSCEF
ncbi:hypothetical protein C1646_674148 [Rhizophagus diaphanus]|nr:hypothetical protein C1646_674148 [Rhizophagus diaphanus] [Rhizophagus sp. MUCL 43196]